MRKILKMKKRDIMKSLVSMHILCLLFLSACANNNNQIPKSLSSAYDGIWDGLAQTPGGDQYIKMEIKDGIVSGLFEYNDNVDGNYHIIAGEKKINGYITSDNKLIINPIGRVVSERQVVAPPTIIFETNVMSPDRIEGIYKLSGQRHVWQASKYDWYVVKPATGKSESTAVIFSHKYLLKSKRRD